MLTETQLDALLSDVECEPYKIRKGPMDDGWFIQVTKWRKCCDTGEMGWGHGGKLYVSPHSTVSEVVQKCLGACIAFAEHETREAFKWDGKRIYGPHILADSLWTVADMTESRAVLEQ